MTDRPELGPLYRQTRLRTTALLSGDPDPAVGELPVPATPGWTVHDVLAHLVGIAAGAAGPVPAGGPDDEWTARQVAWGRERSMTELLDAWAEMAEEFEARVDRPQAVIDAVTHEYDLRGALQQPGDRDDETMLWASRLLRRGLAAPAPMILRTEDGDTEVRVSGDAPPTGEPVVLTTTVFEFFRWRMGRRSRAQLAAMDWSGDPSPFLDHLCVFGPSPVDIVE
jgi:hypothetical protein